MIDETFCNPALCKSKTLHLNRLIADLDTYALRVAKARIVELEETVARLNKKIYGGNP